MILLHLEYGDFVVESSGISNVDKLERFQEKCLRLTEYQAPENRKKMSNLKIKFRIEDLKIRRKWSSSPQPDPLTLKHLRMASGASGYIVSGGQAPLFPYLFEPIYLFLW